MQIAALARELGVRAKDVLEFLREKGQTYKSHFNKISEADEKLVREKFTGKGAAPVEEAEEGKSVATIIRRRGERRRSFVPEEERSEDDAVEEDVFETQLEEETEAHVEQEVSETAPSEVEAPSAEAEEREEAEPAIEDIEPSIEPRNVVEEKPSEENAPEIMAEEDEQHRKPVVKHADRGEEKKPQTEEEEKRKKKVVLRPEEPKSTAKKAPKKAKATPKQRRVIDKFRGDVGHIAEDVDSQGIRNLKKRRKKKKIKEKAPAAVINPTKAIKKIIKIEDTVLLSDLAKRMGLKAAIVIRKMMEMGEIAGINDRLNFDTATLVAEEFGFQVENVAQDENYFIEAHEDTEDELVKRAPVVTVMGHVDHGKTKLLDAIRNTNVVDGEAGGITQHIGAYTVETEEGSITFLDTPGHEAFTGMRSRGAQATDVVILVVAADDGVMPQTVEAINHAKAAGVPIIVAVNKIDKPEANTERVRQELLKYEIVPEEWGGDNLFVEISAKQRINIDKLLESVLLQVEMMDLKANPNKRAVGVVIESKMDLGRGPVATTLISEGTLKVGDLVVVGASIGYVRSMIEWTGKKVKEALPANAVEITGLDSVPSAGEFVYAFEDEKKAKGLVELRKNKAKAEKFEKEKKMSLESLFSRIEEGETMDLNIIVKADVDGSVEAIVQSLGKIEHDKIRIKVIHSGVGGITENDVLLASASNGIIIGFNVRVDNKSKQLASAEDVDVKIYSIIYDLINEVKAAMTGMLAPIITEEFIGKAEVRALYKVPKAGTIAGCMVLEGRVTRKCKVKLVRENIVIYEGFLSSLKRYKDDVKEVKSGYECGMGVENYNDLKEGDILEFYEDRETADEVK